MSNFTQRTTFKDSSTEPFYISKMEKKVNLLQVKKCNVLFTKMKSFKIASCPFASCNRMREGR